jgi:hypothetical protein
VDQASIGSCLLDIIDDNNDLLEDAMVDRQTKKANVTTKQHNNRHHFDFLLDELTEAVRVATPLKHATATTADDKSQTSCDDIDNVPLDDERCLGATRKQIVKKRPPSGLSSGVVDGILGELTQTANVFGARQSKTSYKQAPNHLDNECVVIEEWNQPPLGGNQRGHHHSKPAKYNVDDLLEASDLATGKSGDKTVPRKSFDLPITQSGNTRIEELGDGFKSSRRSCGVKYDVNSLVLDDEEDKDAQVKKLNQEKRALLQQARDEDTFEYSRYETMVDMNGLSGEIKEKKKGSEWLREITEATRVYLNETTTDDAVEQQQQQQNVGQKSPPSMITLNNSNLFLNESDLKKRKSKFIRNGYAEKLQKLLIRQASSVNFVKHHMNRNNPSSEQTQKCK